MNINPNWQRWITASVNKHFNTAKGDYTLYIEGDERVTSDEGVFAELRSDGPFFKRPCKGLVYMDVEINVLIQAVMDPTDLYVGPKIAGYFAAIFTNIIRVYKYGNGNDDDDTLLGCLRQRDDRNHNSLDIGNFGIIRQDTRITQMTIEGHYRLELQE